MTIQDGSPGSGRGFAFSANADDRLYLRPAGLLPLARASEGKTLRPLAGGPLGFAAVELIARRPNGVTDRTMVPAPALQEWADGQDATVAARIAAWLGLISAGRGPVTGLPLHAPRIMGIVNVTPDSFSDGGSFADPAAAAAHGRALAASGADILDIGGESTRPGAHEVPAEVQIARVVPVIEALADSGAVLSVDTRSAAVMRAAVAAGAAIINDVSALSHDPDALATARDLAVPVILTHMRGAPETMADHAQYDDVSLDVFDELERHVQACVAAGIPREQLIIDPGFGFAKTRAQNVVLLSELAVLHGLGCAIAVGASRKSFAPGHARIPTGERLPASLAAAFAAADQGAQILRVHDVRETCQMLAVWRNLALGAS